MKTKVSILILLIFTFFSKGFSQVVDDKDVPDAVKKGLSDKFTVTGTPDWEKQDDNYSAEFYAGNYKGICYLKSDGTYIKSEMEIDPKTVPDPVKTYINEHFKGFSIEYAKYYDYTDKKDNYYYVTAPKTIKGGKKYIPEFNLTAKGKLISEDVPTELDSYRTMAAEPTTPVAKTEGASKKQGGATKKEPTGSKQKATGKGITNTKTAKKEAKEDASTGSANEETSTVPQAVRDLFSKKFKQVTNVKWETTETNYIASYDSRNIKNFAYYTKDEKFEKNQTTVDKKAIPPLVQKTINTNYEGQKVESIFNTIDATNQKFFEVKLSQKQGKTLLYTTIYTSPSGQVIKEILPESEEKQEEQGEGQAVNKTSIPQPILGAFNLKYAKATQIKWTRSDSNYVANFFFKGDKTIAEYTTDGKWQQTTKDVPILKLPPPVQNFLRTKYAKEKIESSQYIETNKKEKYYYIVTTSMVGKGKDRSKKTNMMKLTAAAKVIEQTYE